MTLCFSCLYFVCVYPFLCFQTFIYSKKSADTAIRLRAYIPFAARIRIADGFCSRLFFTFNGTECPTPIDTAIGVFMTNDALIQMATHSGRVSCHFCRKLSMIFLPESSDLARGIQRRNHVLNFVMKSNIRQQHNENMSWSQIDKHCATLKSKYLFSKNTTNKLFWIVLFYYFIL